MDVVYVQGLTVKCVIGVLEWEQAIQQTVVFDLEMATDVAKAAATENLQDAIDYSAVAEAVTTYAQSQSFQLIETLAEKVAALLQDQFSVPWVRIKLSKPGAVKGCRDVGVIIERGSRD